MTGHLSRRQALAALAGAGTAVVLPSAAGACARVFWNDNPVKLVGRTLDWSRNFDEAMWVLPAGMERAGRAPYSGISGTYPTWYRSIMDPGSRVYYVQTTITPNTFWVEMDKLDLKPGAAPRKLPIFDPELMGEASRQFKEATSAV